MLKNITIQDQIYEKLNEMIIKTELYPGQKLSESRLMKRMEVGRTPIRESIKQLKKQNLLYTFPQSGTYVSKIDLDQANYSRFLRLYTEREVMAELCDVLDESSEISLKAILDQQKLEFKNGNISKYHDLDDAFHRTCYEILGKGQIWKWIRKTSVHLDRLRWLNLKNITFDYNQVLEEHQNILAAMNSGNKAEVKILVEKHINFMASSQTHIIDKYPDYFLEKTKRSVQATKDTVL
ncbi:DNA-binding transcriptional regulator, GntR family [Alkalibacterium subtropicum]|uniref:DNA-binding transcriptional regulator, GntR family n=1 Tax=Alkalibacterium subtropicum TaxID=753702 RepID=A0A1I1FJJ8_9LACT|nr:GntR family transcriptional regulator [Alkalibacterium subtropicum]SFB97283.1 DNA-binding transcriptional regulator, GntR family [Alkalibacterium subtropicum]